MFEIIKKANRFSDDVPEVIDRADSLSEAEALAHDYQVNRYGPSAFVTFRRFGEHGPEESATDSEFRIVYHEMSIEGFEAQRFVVAKVRRISSPPVERSTSDSMASALGRLVDIVRLGKESRAFADLKGIEWLLKESFQTDAEGEWAAYLQVVCQTLSVERLEPFPLKSPEWLGQDVRPDLQVVYHKAEMSGKPYVIATVGRVFGSPAAKWLLEGHERESALFRLLDQFRIGENGQCYKDFVESGRRQGKAEQDIRAEWLVCEQAVLSERYRSKVRKNLLGTGIFMWDAAEQRQQRYGYFFLSDHKSGTVEPVFHSEQAIRLQRKKVKLTAKVLEVRQGGQATLLSTPEVGEEIVLGVGTLDVRPNADSPVVYDLGLIPGDGRELHWIDPHYFRRLHDQTVEIWAEETDEPPHRTPQV